MSRENVELVERGYAAWNRGDMDAMLALFEAEFEFVPSGVLPGLAPVYRGHQGWRDFSHAGGESSIRIGSRATTPNGAR